MFTYRRNHQVYKPPYIGRLGKIPQTVLYPSRSASLILQSHIADARFAWLPFHSFIFILGDELEDWLRCYEIGCSLRLYKTKLQVYSYNYKCKNLITRPSGKSERIRQRRRTVPPTEMSRTRRRRRKRKRKRIFVTSCKSQAIYVAINHARFTTNQVIILVDKVLDVLYNNQTKAGLTHPVYACICRIAFWKCLLA